MSTLGPSRWGAGVFLAALICAVLAVSGFDSTATAQAVIDYDSDGDGLIEVTNQAQLNAIRWDLDGSGVVDDAANATKYAAAFPTPATNMGCPGTTCGGYELERDISLTSDRAGQGWAPIGSGTPPAFTATFEGNGRTISNLFMDRITRDNVGLFGATGSASAIRNVKLTNVDVTGNNNVGALVGLNGDATNGGGQIDNCEATGTVTANAWVGGLVGNNYGPIAGSRASVAVTATRTDGSAVAGGLVGQNLQTTITNSHASGDVTASHNTVGGLVGSNYDDLAWTTAALPRNAISGSTASGTVTTTGSNVGGLVGWNSGPITDSAALNPSVSGADAVGGLVGTNNDAQADGSNPISGSTARGTVTATGSFVGGLVGWNNGPISDSSALNPSVTGVGSVGGLVGSNSDAQSDGSNAISGSTARGTVTATGNDVGGLVGWNNGPISDSSALNPRVSGENWVGGLVGLTASTGVTIDRSIATADVTGHTGVAGLVGLNHGTTRDSYASGAVRGINSFIGGLVGDQVTGEVVNSRADGAVSGEALTPAISIAASIVGGLVGRNEGLASITGSVATGAVTGTTPNTNSDQFGGLVGSNKGSISGSVATGAVSAGQFVGGLVGQQGIATASVTESWASGDVRAVTDASVDASGRLVGGLVGSNFGTVGASFATGNVTGYGSAGGLIGQSTGTVIATYATGNVRVSDMPPCLLTSCTKDAGGLIGHAGRTGSASDVRASYATGRVSGSSGYSLGGLAGSALTTSTFTNSYWDNQTSGQPDVGVGADDENMNGVIDGTETATMGVTGQTTTALRTPIGYTGIFVDWSVTIPGVAARTGGPWDFGGATDYPVLRGLGALPSFPAGTARLSIAEERAAGTTIGSPLTATDPDSNTLTYKLVGAGGSHFGIDGMTGQLMTKTNLDYEKPVDGDRDNTYEFMVQASDGMTVAFRSVSVSVSNAIDNLSPPAISGSATVAVAENSTAVARYSATDPDRATSTFAWSLAGNDAGAFNISASGVLTFATPPDYEAPGDIGTDNGDNIYEVTVQADDGGMTGELDVLVTVQAVDEPPVIDGDVRVTLREGASHHVGTYSTTDPEGAVVSWETLAGPDARYFALDIGGGLSFVDTPDYEARANKVYTVIVRAADASVPPKIGELTVTVTITNVNEAPTIEGRETIDVNEGHAGTLETYRRVDPEGSLTNWGTISSPTVLSGRDADRFRFDKQTGRLTFAAPPDFEEGGGQYEVTVDANDGELEGMLNVTVNVVNVEESGTLTFDRRRPVAGQETTATLTDPDNVVGATTWTWHRSTSRSGGWAEITAANTPTYTPVTGDSGNYLRATVTYEDGDASGKTLQAVTEFATVAANATNTAPELPDTAVTIDLPENALPDRNVGSRVQATDVDNDPITYSLSGSEFVIDQKTGQIRVAPDAEFDFESGRTSYTVTVTADDGFSSGSDTVGVTITITDVQEPPVAADDGERLDEDPLNGIEIRRRNWARRHGFEVDVSRCGL